MGLKTDVALMFAGGIVRMADLATDFLYVTTTKYARSDIEIVLWVSIFAPFGILLLICMIGTIKDLIRCNRRQALKTFLSGLLFTITDPTGLTLITAGFVVLSTKADIADRTYLEILSKITGFLEALVESIPQLILQTANNQLLGGGWTVLAIFSIVLSTCSITYSLIRLLVLCDQFKKAEDEKDLQNVMSANKIINSNSEQNSIQDSIIHDNKKKSTRTVESDSASKNSLASHRKKLSKPDSIKI